MPPRISEPAAKRALKSKGPRGVVSLLRHHKLQMKRARGFGAQSISDQYNWVLNKHPVFVEPQLATLCGLGVRLKR